MPTKLFRLKLLLNLILPCLVLILLVESVSAQSTPHYKIHTVTKGETFKSIAEIYNVNAEELADYNNLDYYGGPLVSKTLRIPVKPVKAAAKKEVVAQEVTPVKKTKVDIVAKPVKKIETPLQVIVTPEIHPSYKTATDEGKENINSQSSSSANDITGDSIKKSRMPSFKDIFPLLIFLTVSVVLLITGVYWYKSLSEK